MHARMHALPGNRMHAPAAVAKRNVTTACWKCVTTPYPLIRLAPSSTPLPAGGPAALDDVSPCNSSSSSSSSSPVYHAHRPGSHQPHHRPTSLSATTNKSSSSTNSSSSSQQAADAGNPWQPSGMPSFTPLEGTTPPATPTTDTASSSNSSDGSSSSGGNSSSSGEDKSDSPAVKAALAMLNFYRSAMSPMMQSTCRFLPTCSQYAIDSYKQYGVAKGSVLTAWRLMRCNPWGDSGYDPSQWPPPGLGWLFQFPFSAEVAVVLGSAAFVRFTHALLFE